VHVNGWFKFQPGLILFVFFFIGSCLPDKKKIGDALETNLALSGKNRPELEKVLNHYRRDPGDSLKWKAAVFLLSNLEDKVHYDSEWLRTYDSMFSEKAAWLDNEQIQSFSDSIKSVIGNPEKKDLREKLDLQYLTSDYLIRNIDQAYSSWQNAPWKSEVSFNAFCNYILPYFNYNEFPQDDKSVLYDKYQYLLKDSLIPHTMEDLVCAQIDDQITWMKYSEELDYPGALNMQQILKIKKGDCVEMANLGAQAARAFGIPATIDYVDGHHWNALILSDENFEAYSGAGDRPGDLSLLREADSKFTKVYRKQLARVPESFGAKAGEAGIKNIPEFFRSPRITDVTSQYTLVTDLEVRANGKDGDPVYLCVYRKHGFEPVAGEFISNHRAIFRQSGQREVYIPMVFKKGKYEAAGPAVVVPVKGSPRELVAREDQLQTMVLTRRYSFKRWMEWILEAPMISARFEGGRDSAFTNPVLLHEIKRIRKIYRSSVYSNLDLKDRFEYDSIWKQVVPARTGPVQFIRLVFQKGKPLKLGELEFYSQGPQALKGKPMGNIPDASLAFDGVPGRSIKQEDTSKSYWVGLDLGEAKQIDKIRYIAAGDSHEVEAGRIYELFYWKDKWKSAGKQKASSPSLVFDQVLGEGLYLLRCYNCENTEERPFTYENGKQVWW